jgi:20S proteasome subunit beta 1
MDLTMDFGGPQWTANEVQLGTTIMAVEFDGGVVMGADSRTSTGSYVSNRASNKITALTDNVYICRSGSAADTQTISDYVRYFLHQHVVEKGDQSDVKTAANLVKQMAYQNKNNLQAGMIVAGWDKHLGGQVYGIPLGGTLLRLPFTIGGSGSSYIYGFCDQAYKEKMTRQECEDFVVKAVSLAMARDGSSGGVIRTATITETGVERKMIAGDKLPLWFEEIPVEPGFKPFGKPTQEAAAA